MPSQEMFCRTASCRGFWGFDVHWTRATETCPPYPAIDYCPHCHMDIFDRPYDHEDAISGLLEALDESDTGVDPHALLVAIQANLEEQRRALADRLKNAPVPVFGPEERMPL